jgi:protoheme IX farnesyltransferase
MLRAPRGIAMDQLRSYSTLCKAPISCYAACSAVTGYLLAPTSDPIRMAFLALGVLLLAAGASALNQYQERDIDARMDRTRLRPLPAGTMAPRTALTLSAILLVSGLILLGTIGPVVTALGAFTVLWYNGLYTPLKRRTAFAAVPGALVGVLPPVMGWVAAGGKLADPKVLVLAALFFLWQVPHFWLLHIAHRESYEQAGLPHISRIFPGDRLTRMTFLWTAAASVACLGLPLFGLGASPFVTVLLPLPALALVVRSIRLLQKDTGPATALAAFRSGTAFLAAIMVLLSLDALIRRS